MSTEFQKAATDVKNLTSSPNNDELLELYGLYKIANGEDFTKADKPGMFDLKVSRLSHVDTVMRPLGLAIRFADVALLYSRAKQSTTSGRNFTKRASPRRIQRRNMSNLLEA